MTLQPGTFNMELYRGDSYDWSFRLWTDDEKTQAADLTGAIARAQIRNSTVPSPGRGRMSQC